MKYPLIGIIGPTAVGKTKLATALAYRLDAEILSADSRQVYRDMNIGTGKDYEDFTVKGKLIPCHLIDIVDAGEEYNVFQYQKDFFAAYRDIVTRDKQPILCGGTGLYIEAALRPTAYLEVPENPNLRKALSGKENQELQESLMELKPNQHNISDLSDRQRMIRAIEIEVFKQSGQAVEEVSPIQNSILFGLSCERKVLRERIAKRLDHRLQNGLIEEVQQLHSSGISFEKLKYYGLEYRFVSEYLQGELQKNDMRNKLLQAIRQFAKRQDTWFRRMQKHGQQIHRLDAEKQVDENSELIMQTLEKIN